MLAIVMPSRGLIHSRTMESVLVASSHLVGERGFFPPIYFSNDKPIPECFNSPINRALKDGATHLTIIEEDMVIPPTSLLDMIKAIENDGVDIAWMDYPLYKGKMCSNYFGKLPSFGTGAVMFTKEAIEKLLPFTSEYLYNPEGERLGAVPDRDKERAYGYHDVDMCYKANELGLKSVKVGEAKHLRLVELGKEKVNNGVHTIEEIVI